MKQLIAAATDVARRSQHASVRFQHVLVAIVEGESFWRKYLPPIARHVLMGSALDLLSALPAEVGYRGAVTAPPLAPEADDLFAPPGWLRQQLHLGIVLKRLRAHTRLIEEAWLDLRPLSEELNAAKTVASARGSVVVRAAHVQWSIADRAWFQHAVVTVGGDRDRVVAELADRMATFDVGQIDVMRPSEHVRSLLEQCHRSSRAYPATADTFLFEVLRDDRMARLYRVAGIDVDRLQALLADGV